VYCTAEFCSCLSNFHAVSCFFLFQAEEGGCEPKHSFAADSKGSVGHNVVMYWHSLKPLPAGVGARGTQSGVRGVDAEGVVAGSVAGKHH
jgi:hypothetical protein